ncbi:ATP-binding protein [Caenimonas soli]|uniref:ATP-binding protein n=1 Tax=Caenimonas soli TaxID=2735555 RepID=UPI001553F502|nr:SbcC/MukB-like Walker B domain-containing protein [Caenimonas soli]NPC56915.1 ATP-binding protein [Caenimonas soli]
MDATSTAEPPTLAASRQASLAVQPGRELQFQLRRIQTYNWGTFDKLREIHIASQGHLVLGPSGSGKSTLLDGHTSLLTPPRWLDFNTAARSSEKGSGDRSLATYVRGAWATQTGEEGEKVKRYLRTGTTWSALSETYQDGTGRTIVLGRILWIKGSGSAESDVHRLFFITERDFHLRELQFFKDEGTGFEVRRLKAKLSDVHFTDEFSGYQTRFTRQFDIKSDRALRLLHKTQSAKDLGDLNKFLRDFMLDSPETFTVAETLVNEFQVLNSAHEAVLTARLQIESLRPVQEALEQYESTKTLLSLLSEERAGVDYWREQHRRDLLQTQMDELSTKAEGLGARIAELKTKEKREEAQYNAYLAMRAGAGGNLLADLQGQLDRAERVRLPEVSGNHDRMAAACRALDWAMPGAPESFAETQAEAKAALDGRDAMAERHEQLLDRLKGEKRIVEERFGLLAKELKALEGRTSNMPSHLLGVREKLCHELSIPEEDLPFVGELLQVKAKESDWTGAIERVLGGFATSLLVEERYYREVAAYVDRTHLGQRLVYLRMTARASQAPVTQPAANSLLRKLDIAPKHREWVSEELRRFDYACVESPDELRTLEKGVTIAGQVKHSRSRHEKDDRKRINERGSWVLGFSNIDKRAVYEKEAAETGTAIDKATKALEKGRETIKKESDQVYHCQTLVNVTWENTNVAALLGEIKALKDRIEQEFKARPQLSELEKKVDSQRETWDKATKARQRAEGDLGDVVRDADRAKKKLDEIPADALAVRLTPNQQERLQVRFDATGKKLTADQIDSACTAMMRAIGEGENTATAKAADIKQTIEHKLFVFCTKWEAEAKGLDAKMESAPDFMAKLERLETDGLHEYVARFKALLREQSDQNLAVLHAKLDQERRNIGERMEQVNESLRRCAFNENTYLKINYEDKPTQEVIEFRGQLKTALSHSFKEDDDEEMERRFSALNAVVQRLGSQQTADVKWRSLVLDVRQHVVFSATEFDDTGIEVETYDSGAGKSGGQRQKLTTTVLAAALRYQLAGEEGVWPTYSTVVMDEAFDRADNEFTAMVMNIFKSFGFQVVAATPVKNVMALEPFIGGGTFVSIRDRKHSEALAITYVDQTGRLDLPLEVQEVLAEELAADATEAAAGEAAA